MKKQIKEKVLAFMESVDTSDMSSNEFIYKFLDLWEMWSWPDWDRDKILNWPSFESILRSRRKVIADYWIGKRTKADSEEIYIEEFARQNKF